MIKNVMVVAVFLCCSTSAMAEESLPPEKRPVACYPPAILEYRDGKTRNYSITLLSKQFTDRPGPLIVLKQSFNGKRVLNPQGEGYPKSTSLKGLSWEDAFKLFGNPRETENGINAFVLQYANGGRCFFTLETKFSDGKLQSYRITGRNIQETKWTPVS